MLSPERRQPDDLLYEFMVDSATGLWLNRGMRVTKIHSSPIEKIQPGTRRVVIGERSFLILGGGHCWSVAEVTDMADFYGWPIRHDRGAFRTMREAASEIFYLTLEAEMAS